MLDSQTHTMNDLFRQLGLAATDEAIDAFIRSHHLNGDEVLAEADFWNRGQADFLRQALQDDADWAEIVDQLDALLRYGDEPHKIWLYKH